MSGELEPLTTSIVVPLTGEYVELDNPTEVAAALETVRRPWRVQVKRGGRR
jgi:hypothetical protein